MPNWVYNSLVVSGDKSELERMVEQLNKPITTNHKQIKKDLISGEVTFEHTEETNKNPVFSFMNIIAPTDLAAYYGEQQVKIDLENFGETFTQAVSEDNSWYYWNIRNWGCKWDICSHSDGDSTYMEWTDEGNVMYKFDTPWSPPTEALIKLSTQFPTLEFDYEFEEEQGWGGTACINNGDYTETDNWDIPGSHADYASRGNQDSCICNYEDDTEAWYDDCPRNSE